MSKTVENNGEISEMTFSEKLIEAAENEEQREKNKEKIAELINAMEKLSISIKNRYLGYDDELLGNMYVADLHRALKVLDRRGNNEDCEMAEVLVKLVTEQQIDFCLSTGLINSDNGLDIRLFPIKDRVNGGMKIPRS